MSPDKNAETSVPVHDLIARRWSPRAFDAEAETTTEQVRALVEAARWAASYGNTQPARFLVGLRGDDTFRRILGTLAAGNQSWAHRAGALLVGVTLTHNDKGELPYAEYGLGLAGQNLVLQAVAEGLAAHQMAGFDAEAVRAEFGLPEQARAVVAIAVGHVADPRVLGEERDVQRELAPRKRIPLDEFALRDWGSAAF